MQELRPGLWTWTATHPSWTERDEEWGPEVRSYAYDSGACLVLFDPIAPPTLLEGLVEAQDVSVLLTAEWHRRSANECVERFGAHIHASTDQTPADVERCATYYPDEVAYWIPRHSALVVGDAFLAEREFKVQDEWLRPGMTRERMHDGLRSLLELPVELVLVTHGDPVLEDGREALRSALEA
ncbi:MAG TPA: hypothetical protein VGQ84_05275 [Gaiellaceae bacterium]|nr:hypothetical protein [Gaiellaceae bacterium]